MSHVDYPRIAALDDAATVRGKEPGRETRARRIRAWTTSSLRDFVYTGGVLLWSIAGFTILVTGVSVTASTIFLVFGVFVWIGFAYVLRWTTRVDRRLAGWQRNEPVSGRYRRPRTRGLLPTLKTVSYDRQTWKDLGWLGVTSIVGFTLGVAVMTAAWIVLTYLSMPTWYWAVPESDVKYGLTNFGVFTVDTFGEALTAAAIGLALTPLVLLLARWAARTHAELAVRFLSPPAA